MFCTMTVGLPGRYFDIKGRNRRAERSLVPPAPLPTRIVSVLLLNDIASAGRAGHGLKTIVAVAAAVSIEAYHRACIGPPPTRRMRVIPVRFRVSNAAKRVLFLTMFRNLT